MEKVYENKFLNAIHYVKKVLVVIASVIFSISMGLIFLAFSEFLHILNYLYIFSGKRPFLEFLCVVILIGIIFVLDMIEKMMKKRYIHN